MTETTTVIAVGISGTMQDRLRAARDRDEGFRLIEAADDAEAIALLGQVAPDVLMINLDLSVGSPLAVADYAAYKRPDVRVIYEMGEETRGFADGSVFALSANAHGCVTPSMRPEDMAAVVAHHAMARVA